MALSCGTLVRSGSQWGVQSSLRTDRTFTEMPRCKVSLPWRVLRKITAKTPSSCSSEEQNTHASLFCFVVTRPLCDTVGNTHSTQLSKSLAEISHQAREEDSSGSRSFWSQDCKCVRAVAPGVRCTTSVQHMDIHEPRHIRVWMNG